ncbi:hypothetical protein GCM10028798_19560 [Humibacter antri]
MAGNILKVTESREVHVRLDIDADRIETVSLVVVPRDNDLVEIDLERHVLGFIERAGQVFVALAGERLDRAEECGQSLLWDQAAAELIKKARLERTRASLSA